MLVSPRQSAIVVGLQGQRVVALQPEKTEVDMQRVSFELATQSQLLVSSGCSSQASVVA